MAVQAVLPSTVDHCSRGIQPQVLCSDARVYAPGTATMMSLFQDLRKSQGHQGHLPGNQQQLKPTAVGMQVPSRGSAPCTQVLCQPSWQGGSVGEHTGVGLASRKRQRDTSDEILSVGESAVRQHQRLRGVGEFSSDLSAVVASQCPSPPRFAEGQPQGVETGGLGTRTEPSLVGTGTKDAAVLASLLASMADDRTQTQVHALLARRLGGLVSGGLASTSGRGVGATVPNTDLSYKDLSNLSMLQQLAAVTQGEGYNQLLRAQQQGEQIKALLEERRQQQLLAAINHEYTQRLRVAGFEIERHRLRTAELEEHVKRLINELAISHSRLRNTEMVVNTLRSNLEHAVALSREEQTGDSDDADDAASSCESDLLVSHARALRENEELREQRACRVCRTNEASTLLLPCRHLCLCHGCEGQLDSCPLCRQPKAASVLVYMS